MHHIAVQSPQDKGQINVNGCMQILGYLITPSLSVFVLCMVRWKMSFPSQRRGTYVSERVILNRRACHKNLYAERFSFSLPPYVGGQADSFLPMTILIQPFIRIYMEQASEHIGAIVTNTVLR